MRKIIVSNKQINHLKKILNETPDFVYLNDDNDKLPWYDDNAIAFGFKNGMAFVSYNNHLFLKSPRVDNNTIARLDSCRYDCRMHANIDRFYNEVLNFHVDVPTDRGYFDYPGRFWYKEKIISFWYYPDKNDLKKLLGLLSQEMLKVYGVNINFNDYRIEVKSSDYKSDDREDDDYIEDIGWTMNRDKGVLIPISNFIGSRDVNSNELNIPHLLPPEEKVKNSQIIAAKNNSNRLRAMKFNGNVSQAEWNSAKKKFQGESVQSLKRELSESYIGSCVDVGPGNRKRINDYFSDATQMAYYCGSPDDGDYGRSEEINDNVFYKYISRTVVPKKAINGDVKYFYISDAGRISVNEAKIFYIYNIDSDIHYFFERNKSMREDIVIPVTTGDTVMMGKFKNKKTTVKDISKDTHGMPTINGKQATTFRVNKDTEITEAKDYVYGEYNGESISVDNESWDAMPFAYADGRVWVGFTPIFGDEYVDAGYVDSDGVNEYPNFHADMLDFYRFINKHNYTTRLPPQSRDYIYWGRVWLDSEIISFYKYPKDKNEMRKITSLLSTEIKSVYGVNVNFDSYIVDTTDNGLVSMTDYVGSADVGDDVINTPHLLPANKKRDNRQLSSSLKSKYNKLSNKLGNTSQAEYNHYKKYGMGEGVNNEQLVEATIEDVNLDSFVIKSELNNKFWDNEKLNVKVRRRLLKIADDFLDFINVDSKYCKDILFLGSLANFNWSRHSDIDLHLLIDFKKINKDVELVRDYFDAKRRLWNDDHSSLKIYNFPVELYVQDVNEENASTGVFSIELNKWLKKPTAINKDILNKNKIKQKSADLMTDIDNLKSEYDKSKNKDVNMDVISKKSKQLFDKIRTLRRSGLESSKGEYSTGNIVFKVLRRSGHLETLIDLKRNTYDIINTIK